jgi:hypothetical protein
VKNFTKSRQEFADRPQLPQVAADSDRRSRVRPWWDRTLVLIQPARWPVRSVPPLSQGEAPDSPQYTSGAIKHKTGSILAPSPLHRTP